MERTVCVDSDIPLDEPGTYTLLVALDATSTFPVGALGEQRLRAGGYAYTGSAFGPGGLGRVTRHRDVASGERDVRHWHVDYLLGHPASTLVGVVALPREDVECAVARTLGAGPVDGFGSSDCGCASHLAFGESVTSLRGAVVAAYEAQ